MFFNNIYIYFIYCCLFFFFFWNTYISFYILFLGFFFIFYIYKKNINFLLYISFLFISIWIINSSNYIELWLSIECQSLIIILLIFIHSKNKIINIESIFKYLIVSAIASICIISGFLYMYINGYLLNIIIFNNFNDLMLYLITFGFILKLGIAPIHFWALEVYLGLNLLSLFILSILPKIIILFIFFFLKNINHLLFFIGIISIIIGCIGGLNQNNIKSLLLYSSINQIGIICISLHLYNMQDIAIFFLNVYFLTLICFFCIILNYNKILLIELSNFSNYNKKIGFIILIILLSWLGLPPLAGFITKWYILITCLKFNFIFIVFLILCSSIISGFFYIRIIKINFSENKSFYINWFDFFIKKRKYIKNDWIIIFLLYFIIFFIINPTPINILINFFLK